MTAPSPGPRPAALAFILLTVLLDVLALGVTIPVLPKLIEAFEGGDTARAARVAGLFGTVWAVMQFFAAPILGALSDRFGRRPVILVSNFGLGADYLLLALAPDLTWLFVARVISGITAASIPTAFAYVADVTPPERRARGFGLLGAAFGLGFVLGPALGGVLSQVEPRLPFWVAAALSLANAGYGLLVLPESLSHDHRAPFRWRRANPVGALVLLLRSRHGLLGLASAVFLYNLAHESFPAVFVFYTGLRYGWDELDVGLTLALVGVCGAVVQGSLTHRVVHRFGERRALLFGLACGVLGFLAYALATSGALLLLGVPIMALWGFSGPAAQSLMSRRVGPDQQGHLQGAQQSLRGIAALIGPGLYTSAFRWGIDPVHDRQLPGTPYALAAGLLALGWFAAAWATRPAPAPPAPLS